MTPPLPPAFTGPPLAHRALHDAGARRAENSAEAIEAAIEAGYGIEVDVQLTADGEAVVFHDDALKRLTGRAGRMREVTLAEALRLPLLGGGSVPSLADCLDLVAGRAALLIEIKDQDGQMGSNVGRLEAAVARTLVGYKGPVAVMSFNPESVAHMAELAPNVPRGLTTAGWSAVGWSGIPAATRQRLRAIPDFERVGASFISHDARDLDRLRVAELKARGVPVLCWTIRSAEEERRARRIADNVTFEGYRPALTAP